MLENHPAFRSSLQVLLLSAKKLRFNMLVLAINLSAIDHKIFEDKNFTLERLDDVDDSPMSPNCPCVARASWKWPGISNIVVSR